GGRESVEENALVLDAERVLEPLQLRDADVQRHLAAFERRGDRAAGLLALGATAGGLAAQAADAATDALAVAVGSGCGLEVVDLHQASPSLTSSTVTRCGTLAIMPRTSGRSGRVFDLPMRPRPSARMVPRCLGFVPIVDLIWVTFRSA